MMPDPRALLERERRRYIQPDGAFERLVERRDRKRRNQRITAGVVGIAVFVAAIWIVTSVRSLDRSATSMVPAGSGTTGPAQTGSTFTQPGTGGHLDPGESFGSTKPTAADSPWLPPEGADPSRPTAGELIADGGGIHPWHAVQVYADGRVIWMRQGSIGWLVRRLTPEGVDLVRSGAIAVEDVDPPTNVPASAWEDSGAGLYVPSRYVVCGKWSQEMMRLLPQRTQDLLRSRIDERAVIDGEANYLAGRQGVACPEVTIEEARALDMIFVEAGFDRDEARSGLAYIVTDTSAIDLIPLLPDGTLKQCCPG